MRYIGSKENLLPFIDEVVARFGMTDGTFADLFAGTTAVARHFKRRGFRIVAADLMAFSYALQVAYLKCSSYPAFERLMASGEVGWPAWALQRSLDTRARPLETVVTHLNGLPGEPGFVHANYSDEGTGGGRRYLTGANAARIDAIRETIERWHRSGLLSTTEYWLLVAAAVEAVPSVSNISGTYGAFLKAWDPRAFKRYELTPPVVIESDQEHEVHLGDANDVVRRTKADVLYLDPPYNARQYVTNYHLLETVARWDRPVLRGKTGLRPDGQGRSVYCEGRRAAAALADLVDHANCRYLLLSYNEEGVIPCQTLRELLGRRGPVEVFRRPYRRFRSDSDRPGRAYRIGDEVGELLYCVQVAG